MSDGSEPLPNPFESPKQVGATDVPPTTASHGNASLGQRFANALIDGICVRFVLATLVGLFLGYRSFFLGLAVSLTTSMGYYILCEGLSGRTLGKLITGTKVVGLDGGAPGFSKVILRTLVRFVPFEPFSFLGNDNVGWHDTWSETRVVRLRPHRFEKL